MTNKTRPITSNDLSQESKFLASLDPMGYPRNIRVQFAGYKLQANSLDVWRLQTTEFIHEQGSFLKDTFLAEPLPTIW